MFTRSVRYDKSLGVLCQKFVMLFLVSPVRLFYFKMQQFRDPSSYCSPKMNEVTLEEAGKYLVPDSQDDQFYVSVNHSSNPKSEFSDVDEY